MFSIEEIKERFFFHPKQGKLVNEYTQNQCKHKEEELESVEVYFKLKTRCNYEPEEFH